MSIKTISVVYEKISIFSMLSAEYISRKQTFLMKKIETVFITLYFFYSIYLQVQCLGEQLNFHCQNKQQRMKHEKILTIHKYILFALCKAHCWQSYLVYYKSKYIFCGRRWIEATNEFAFHEICNEYSYAFIFFSFLTLSQTILHFLIIDAISLLRWVKNEMQ